MSNVTYRIWFERDASKSAREERVVVDPQEAAEIAIEMANRPEGSGGLVIINLSGLEPDRPIYSVWVEPGHSIEWINQQVQEKSARLGTGT